MRVINAVSHSDSFLSPLFPDRSLGRLLRRQVFHLYLSPFRFMVIFLTRYSGLLSLRPSRSRFSLDFMNLVPFSPVHHHLQFIRTVRELSIRTVFTVFRAVFQYLDEPPLLLAPRSSSRPKKFGRLLVPVLFILDAFFLRSPGPFFTTCPYTQGAPTFWIAHAVVPSAAKPFSFPLYVP